jgi:outer membrane protein assembly factor BamB
MRILTGIFLTLLAVTASAREKVEAIYPANPNLSGRAIFVAGSGVTRLELDGLVPSWHSLEGVQPFEPVIAHGLVVVGSPVGLFALDQETGEVKWQLPSDQALFTPTVVGDTAFAGGEDGTLRALDLASGQERWQHRLEGWVFSPAVVGDHLVTGGNSGTLWGLDTGDGSEKWQKQVGEELVFHPVAGTDDPVYVSTTEGTVLALMAATGNLRWQTRVETPTTATVYGNRIFLVQFSGLVTACDRYKGTKLWEYQLKGSSTTPARILDGKLLAITDDGISVMLNPASGEEIDAIPHPEPGPGPGPGPDPQQLQPAENQQMAGL